MTSFLAFGVAAGGGALLLLAALMLARLSAYKPGLDLAGIPEPDSPDGNEPSMLAKYQPMAGLLAEEDFQFLRAQPGYRPAIGAKLRRQRRRIFRMYLRELAGDFHRIHAEAREFVAHSQQPDAELVWILIRQQVTFWRAMAAVELRLAMDQAGLGRVDVRGLLNAFHTMRIDLLRLQVPAATAF